MATVVAPVFPVARYTATSRRETLPTFSALHIISSSSEVRPTFSFPPIIAVVAGIAPSALTISSTLCANSTFWGKGIPWLSIVLSNATTGFPAAIASAISGAIDKYSFVIIFFSPLIYSPKEICSYWGLSFFHVILPRFRRQDRNQSSFPAKNHLYSCILQLP